MSRTTRTPKRTLSGRLALREVALSVTAALGLLALASATLMLVLGLKPLVFLSGSMEPGIATGALAMTVSTPAADLAEGDIISFLRSDGARVTHRIASIEPEGSVFKVITRGDANDTDDPEPSYLTEADRLFWHVDGAGEVITEVTKFQYSFPFGVFIGMVALSGFRRLPSSDENSDESAPSGDEVPDDPSDTDEVENPAAGEAAIAPTRRAKHAALPVLAVGAALALGTAGLSAPVGTLAAFTDGGQASSTYSAAPDFRAPGAVDAASITCTSVIRQDTIDVTFAWSKPVGTVTRYGITLTLVDNPTLYNQNASSTTGPQKLFTISNNSSYYGTYRFTVTAYNEGVASATTTKTVMYQATGATC